MAKFGRKFIRRDIEPYVRKELAKSRFNTVTDVCLVAGFSRETFYSIIDRKSVV